MIKLYKKDDFKLYLFIQNTMHDVFKDTTYSFGYTEDANKLEELVTYNNKYDLFYAILKEAFNKSASESKFLLQVADSIREEIIQEDIKIYLEWFNEGDIAEEAKLAVVVTNNADYFFTRRKEFSKCKTYILDPVMCMFERIDIPDIDDCSIEKYERENFPDEDFLILHRIDFDIKENALHDFLDFTNFQSEK